MYRDEAEALRVRIEALEQEIKQKDDLHKEERCALEAEIASLKNPEKSGEETEGQPREVIVLIFGVVGLFAVLMLIWMLLVNMPGSVKKCIPLSFPIAVDTYRGNIGTINRILPTKAVATGCGCGVVSTQFHLEFPDCISGIKGIYKHDRESWSNIQLCGKDAKYYTVSDFTKVAFAARELDAARKALLNNKKFRVLCERWSNGVKRLVPVTCPTDQ